jgi:hypothetical protein
MGKASDQSLGQCALPPVKMGTIGGRVSISKGGPKNRRMSVSPIESVKKYRLALSEGARQLHGVTAKYARVQKNESNPFIDAAGYCARIWTIGSKRSVANQSN